jgi:phage shock protein PspC (stress-responsive transcriptional regulator)
MKKFICIIVAIAFLTTTIGCGGVSKAPTKGESVKLARVIDQGIFGGVCSGFAYFTGTPTWIWRAGFVVFSLLGGSGILVYVVLWAFMPYFDKTPSNYLERVGG